jgi:carboxymethylenebutenolidase
MKTAEAVVVIRAAVEALKAHPRCSGKVGITGFCLGGAVSIAASCNVPGLSAAVPFYGTPRDEFAGFTASTPPLLGHFGQRDSIIPRARVEELAARAAAAGGSFEVAWYDAGHAFMRAHDPAAYEPKSAELAWTRTLAFLRDRLA